MDFKVKLQEQLNHHFYKAADKFGEEVKMETLRKAAKKYNEPFNPASWSNEQLAKHAMAENYDQKNYIYGMYERMNTQQKEIEQLKAEIEEFKTVADYWRLRCMREQNLKR